MKLVLLAALLFVALAGARRRSSDSSTPEGEELSGNVQSLESLLENGFVPDEAASAAAQLSGNKVVIKKFKKLANEVCQGLGHKCGVSTHGDLPCCQGTSGRRIFCGPITGKLNLAASPNLPEPIISEGPAHRCYDPNQLQASGRAMFPLTFDETVAQLKDSNRRAKTVQKIDDGSDSSSDGIDSDASLNTQVKQSEAKIDALEYELDSMCAGFADVCGADTTFNLPCCQTEGSETVMQCVLSAGLEENELLHDSLPRFRCVPATATKK